MSRSEPRVDLHVTSEDPAVRITVVDHSLAPVAEGVQTLDIELPPGLYATRFEAGASVREQLVSLAPGSDPVRVHEPRIAFASAAPLADTHMTEAHQSEAASRVSREVHRSLGSGGQLMLFVRDHDLRARSHPANGLTLHDAAGRQSGDVETDGGSGGGEDREHPPWAACTYELTPGFWTLRCPAARGTAVEQAALVSAGWQTQVFLERSVSQSGRRRWPDLGGASVLMARSGRGFDPDRADVRAAELARQGLRDRRAVVPENELRRMIYSKWDNPMLGIYGAHLMIHREKPDRKLVATITRNLRSLLGGHPDVRALDLWLSPDAEVADFGEPPMLKSSWSIVVAASASRPELVPRGSMSAAISDHLLTGGPWLRWRAALIRPMSTTESRSEAGVSLAEALAAVAAALPADPKAIVEQASEASPVESGVISYALQAGKELQTLSDVDVVETLGVPRTVAEDAVQAVLERLES